MVSFQATPANGYVFDYWTVFTASGVSTSASNPLPLMVASATQATASFRLISTGSVSCSASPNPAAPATPVTLTAIVSGISQPSYSWTGVVTGSQSTASFTPSQPGGYMAKVTVSGMSGFCFVAVASPALASFRNCIGSSGNGPSCELQPGIYIVPPRFGHRSSSATRSTESYLQIHRSGITIRGTSVTGSSDTILRRGRWYSGTDSVAAGRWRRVHHGGACRCNY